MSVRLIVATRNPGKIAELDRLVAGLELRLVSLDDAGVATPLDEDGATFEENAIAKAEQALALTGQPALADDSGLCVAALGGAPGVHTARYGGPGLTSGQRNARLLDALRTTPPESRQARFECVIALARPNSATITTHGALEGIIASRPSGSGGFGYDPIFFIPSLGVTLAEAAPETKDALSHRGRAMASMRRHIAAWLGQGGA